MNVLIVDDDFGDRKSLQRSCSDAGLVCNFYEADSVPASLAVLEKVEIHCILMDYLLPGEDGLSGIALIHTKYPYIPTIMVTCCGDEVLASNAFKCGALDYHSKDDMNELAWSSIIRDAIDKTNIQRELDETREYLASFSDMLAHDLMSPIGHIVNFVEIAERELQSKNYESLSERLAYIKKSAGNLVQLITAVTAYAQGGRGSVFFSVPVREAVDAAVDMLEEKLQANHVEIEIADNLPVVVGDVALLGQMFMNLIANAIKFNTSSTPLIIINSQALDSGCRISIADNGIGIPERELNEIFKPFKRGKLSPEFKGTGLGLATVERIAHRHKAKVTVENNTFGGSSFHIDFPPPEMVPLGEQY
jgi:signal transduction histidine kinase